MTDFSSLPEGVIANILSLTTPSDACRSSAVSRTFHAAAMSEIAWDRFLPNDLDDLISRRKPNDFNFDLISSSKREIFLSLCSSPLLIDDGNKSFSLEKHSGKKCIMLGARALSIVFGDTSVYRAWESHPESRFAEVLVMLKVWWLQILGKISSRMLSPATTYAAYFVFKTRERRYFGFNIDPVDAVVGIVGSEHYTKKRVCLDPYLDDPDQRRRRVSSDMMSQLERPRERQDGWFETELGEIDNDGGDDEVEIILQEMEKRKRTEGEGEENSELSSMPEGVVSSILSMTTPLDVCRSSAVSGTFYAAAQSDIVWNRFLPPDWECSISPSALNFDPISSSKKEIFFSLCKTPLLIDGGNKSFSLDKWSGGKKCIMLGARDLKISWGDSHYWNWEPHSDSRFAEVAVLINVWWFEIRAKISCKMLSPATTYAAYFVFNVNKQTYYGFDVVPTDAKVGIVDDEESCTNSICLDPHLDNPRPSNRRHLGWLGNGRSRPYENSMARLERRPKKRQDGWFEVELGEFQSGDNGDDEVEMSLVEVQGKSSKSGLVVEGIEIRPKISHVLQ